MFLTTPEIYLKKDEKTQFFGVIAFNDRSSRVNLGGCRCLDYSSPEAAISDAIKLAKTMSYKTALCDLNYGGAKAVLMRPKEMIDHRAYFETFGRFVEGLKGRFITGCDSGVSQEEMQIAASMTTYITALQRPGNRDYLSYFTALGVKCAIERAINFKLKSNCLNGLHVGIQGIGKIGNELAKMLVQHGVKLTITDADTGKAQQLAHSLGASFIHPENIYQLECDVFSPCALAGVINDQTIHQIRAPIICGAANNQLENDQISKILSDKNILYVPDFVANLGGTMYAADSYLGLDKKVTEGKVISNISENLEWIFKRSSSGDLSMVEAAEQLIHHRKFH